MRKRQKKKDRNKKFKAYMAFSEMVEKEYSGRQVMREGYHSFFEPGRAESIIDNFYDDYSGDFTPIFGEEP